MKSFNEWRKDRDSRQDTWTQKYQVDDLNRIDDPNRAQMNQWRREKKKNEIEKNKKRARRRANKNFFRRPFA